jgi:hypothetical protein
VPFCPQCGVDNPESARFCDQCGAALIPVAAKPAAAAPQPATMPPAPAAPVAAGPTRCPQCGASVIPGEAFCDTCGAPLSAPARAVAAAPAPAPAAAPSIPAQPVYPPPQPAVAASMPGSPAPAPAPPPMALPRMMLAPGRLVVVATGTQIPLPASGEAIIGRADPVSQFTPDVDLTPLGALEQGVGRRHARLFIQGGRVLIEDLDSTNGTQVNGQRLAPRQPRPLDNGDTIQFGRLALQFLM